MEEERRTWKEALRAVLLFFTVLLGVFSMFLSFLDRKGTKGKPWRYG